MDSTGRSPVPHVVAGVGTSSALQPHHAGPIPGWGHLPTSNYPRAPSQPFTLWNCISPPSLGGGQEGAGLDAGALAGEAGGHL